MIDKNELRIGNLVFVDGHRERFFTVLQLKSKVAVVKGASIFQAEYEILAPVPLTREILLGNRFTGHTYMQKEIGQDLILGLHMAEENGLYELSLMGAPKKEVPDHHPGNSGDGATDKKTELERNSIRLLPIRYLHQLQNTMFEIGQRQTI